MCSGDMCCREYFVCKYKYYGVVLKFGNDMPRIATSYSSRGSEY